MIRKRLCLLMKPITLFNSRENLYKTEHLRTGHLQQTVKHPPENIFWDSFTSTGPGNLVHIGGMLN